MHLFSGLFPSPSISSERVSSSPTGIERATAEEVSRAVGPADAVDVAIAEDASPASGAASEDKIEASETGAAVAVAIPAHVFTAFRRQSEISSEFYSHLGVFFNHPTSTTKAKSVLLMTCFSLPPSRNSQGRSRFRAWRLRACKRFVPSRFHPVFFDDLSDVDQVDNESSGQSRYDVV